MFGATFKVSTLGFVEDIWVRGFHHICRLSGHFFSLFCVCIFCLTKTPIALIIFIQYRHIIIRLCHFLVLSSLGFILGGVFAALLPPLTSSSA